MGIKSSIALYKGIVAAGFSLVKDRSVESHDGLCWNATLKHGQTEILQASNGGYGGPDEVHILLSAEDQKQGALKPFIDKLYGVSEVADSIRRQEIDSVNFRREHDIGEGTDFDAEIEAIKIAPLKRDEETIAGVIADFADAKKAVASLKRAVKTKICWIEKGPEADSDSYTHVKMADNPENRAAVMKRYGATIDVLIADLLQGL
ncbi:hypothetical protein [Cupriavidus sp. TMH.W2]|uniref:hypothetical protein n=1 Tax=Cupriavidus sp. TMH.W2 TaxID=3434465 RepID=UPI003D783633